MNKYAKAALIFAASQAYAVSEAYRFAFTRNRSPLSVALFEKKTHAPDYYERRDGAAKRLGESVHLCYSMLSERGEELRGFYFPCARRPTKKIAFIVHGYHSDHLETAGMFYELYHKRGFDVFACDNTASGESGGNIIGYDVLESEDCLKWIYFLINEFGADIQIIMHGFSLGGATVLKMSDRCPDNVKFTVSDCGFISAAELIRSQIGPLYPAVYRLNRLIGGYDLNDSDVSGNVSASKQPFLIVHGRDDRIVPFSMAERIFELCPNDKDKLFVDGAKHMESIHNARERYEAKLDEFIGKYVR